MGLTGCQAFFIFAYLKMLSEFEKKVLDFMKAEELLQPSGKILLAVSGGTDSIALLYSMLALKAEGQLGADLLCVHLNHQLRGSQADRDEDFVTELACGLNLEIIRKRMAVRSFARRNKLSVETAGRKWRIETLLDIAKTNGCKWIATGHHKGDNAETILQRLARGTGFRGLGGIWPMRDFGGGISFIRPLLCLGRDEIVDYLKKRGLKWREDSTNQQTEFRRNFIRHQLIPQMQRQCDGSLVEELSDLAAAARKFYSFVHRTAEKIWLEIADAGSSKVELGLSGFLEQPEYIRIELIRKSLAWLGGGERDLTEGHYKRVLELAKQKVSHKKIELPGEFLVWRGYKRLVFARASKSRPPGESVGKTSEVEIPGKTKFGNYLIEATVFESAAEKKDKLKTQNSKSKTIERFDYDKISFPLKIRFRKKGDRFVPLGLAGEKKVGKFLTDAQVPLNIRENILVVTDSEKIIWVWPIRISEPAKITDRTKNVLQLRITDVRC